MLQVGQVAAKHVYDQLLPSTADATNRERMLDYHGVSLEKAATKARGYILLTGDPGESVPAGTTVSFPATSFADGVARSYVTTDDASFRLDTDAYTMDIVNGSTEWRLFVANQSGAANQHGAVAGEIIKINYSGSLSEFNVIKRVNTEDSSIDLYFPMYAKPVAGQTLSNAWTESGDDVCGTIVAAECTVAGKSGNASRATVGGGSSAAFRAAQIIEMAGGGDAIVGADSDENRQVRIIEDVAAGAPGLGNAAHWREIAMSCPDVDVEDAIVFSHARGPGTIDIVAIGRKQRMVSTSFPAARTDFTHAFNGRRIGAVQAAKVQEWCNRFASYHDDVLVRPVEYEFRGEDAGEVAENDIYGSAEFFRSVTDLRLTVTPQDGYGPDCGTAFSTQIPYLFAPSAPSRLYPSTSSQVPSVIKPGQRVWVRARIDSSGLTATRSPVITVVTTVLSVDKSNDYVTVANLAKVDGTGGNFYSPSILDWGPAGPLTQPVLDAVYDYYDQLGPGSYIDTPKDPGYVRQFFTGSSAVAPYSGIPLKRWPPEGRRRAGGFRSSELLAKVMAIKGVKSVTSTFADFDPLPFHTLAPRSVVARY
jgi:hypothetical protein